MLLDCRGWQRWTPVRTSCKVLFSIFTCSFFLCFLRKQLSKHHYRKSLECRVPRSLPCAFYRAHDKEPLCRVPQRKRTAKKYTRQNPCFAVCLHTAKILPCTFFWHMAKLIVCRVLFLAHGKVIIFFSLLTSKFFLPTTYNM